MTYDPCPGKRGNERWAMTLHMTNISRWNEPLSPSRRKFRLPLTPDRVQIGRVLSQRSACCRRCRVHFSCMCGHCKFFGHSSFQAVGRGSRFFFSPVILLKPRGGDHQAGARLFCEQEHTTHRGMIEACSVSWNAVFQTAQKGPHSQV